MKGAILHVLHSLDPASGGPAEGQRLICEAHVRGGGKSEVVTLDASNAPWLREWSVPVHALGRGSSYGWTPELGPWLAAHASRFSAVIVHGLWQWQGVGTWLAARRVSVPYYIYPHGMLDPWFRRAFPLRHLRKALYWRLIESRVIRDAAGIIFTAEEERLRGRSTFSPWCAKREIVIPLGTTPPGADRESLRARFLANFPELQGKPFLLFLSRIHEKKGCDLLLEALLRSGSRQHLVIAGPCEDAGLLARLKAQAAGLSVTFAGPLWREDKWAALAAADAFVLPSHQENFGIAVVEALASGLPVLISNKVNIWREVVADGAAVAEDDTVDGTVRLLERWRTADQDGMRRAAAESHRVRFDIRQTAAALDKLVTESPR